MKKLISEIVSGNNFATGVIALGVIASIALGCNCGKDLDLSNIGKNSNSTTTSSPTTGNDDDSVPSDSVVEGLVKDTTRQFKDAVDSEDFTELYNDASTDFQGTYTLNQVKDAFKTYTDKKKIVVPILDKADAQAAEFDSKPSLRSEKGLSILMAKGRFKTKPYNTRFDYEYVMRGGEWKLLKLVINIP